MEIVMVKNKKTKNKKKTKTGKLGQSHLRADLLTARAKKKASYQNIGIYLRGIAGSY